MLTTIDVIVGPDIDQHRIPACLYGNMTVEEWGSFCRQILGFLGERRQSIKLLSIGTCIVSIIALVVLLSVFLSPEVVSKPWCIIPTLIVFLGIIPICVYRFLILPRVELAFSNNVQAMCQEFSSQNSAITFNYRGDRRVEMSFKVDSAPSSWTPQVTIPIVTFKTHRELALVKDHLSYPSHLGTSTFTRAHWNNMIHRLEGIVEKNRQFFWIGLMVALVAIGCIFKPLLPLGDDENGSTLVQIAFSILAIWYVGVAWHFTYAMKGLADEMSEVFHDGEFSFHYCRDHNLEPYLQIFRSSSEHV